MGGQVNTWKLDLNPSNGKYLVYKRQASHPMHLTIHTGKLYMYVTEGVNCILKRFNYGFYLIKPACLGFYGDFNKILFLTKVFFYLGINKTITIIHSMILYTWIYWHNLSWRENFRII
jgi:hypothetical protein